MYLGAVLRIRILHSVFGISVADPDPFFFSSYNLFLNCEFQINTNHFFRDDKKCKKLLKIGNFFITG